MSQKRIAPLLLALSLLSGTLSLAQQHAIGQQNFGSFSGGPDIINLGNLNVHLDIPIIEKQGRGIPFVFNLAYNSVGIWTPVTVGSTTTWTPQPSWGWPSSMSAAGFIPSFAETDYQIICNPGTGTKSTIKNRAYTGYVDIGGTLHHAPNLTTSTFLAGGPECSGNSIDAVATTDDGSGYTITILHGRVAPSTATVTAKNGAQFTAPISSVGTFAEDTNGNVITFNSTTGQFFDTLSATTPVLTVTGTNPVNYTYTPPSGTNVSVVVSYKSYPIQTHFQCSTVTDYGASAPINNNLVDKVTLADGSFYQFGYEPTVTGSQNVTGRIASVKLPTGGTISYVYTGNNGGINCADGSTMGFNRTTPDSATAWHYSRTGSNPSWTTTVTDPLSNTTTYNLYEIVSTNTIGQGSQAATQTLYTYYERNQSATGQTILTCYNATYASCATAAVTLPISQVDKYITLDSKTKATEVLCDTANFGRVTETKVFDFGVTTGSAPSASLLLTDTSISYASLTGIYDRPSQITIKDGGGDTKSQTTYAYDGGSVTTTSGTPQHQSPPNASRGNVTTVTSLTAGTATLSKTFTYYDTGNVKVATDVNAATATYTYGACGNSFPTQIDLAPVVLTEKMTWDTNCTGAVMTSQTDPNNNVANTSYTTDRYLWRPEYATDLAGNQTNLVYQSLVEAEGTLTFGSSVSDHRVKLDSLGRPYVNQVQQSVGGNYDSIETSYDALGRASFVTLPYSAAAGGICSGSCPGTTTAYDALGRVQTISDSGLGSTAYSYPKGDIYQSVGPPPTGELTKDRQLEYDGAGRLKSVCEITTNLSGFGTCSQRSPSTGYWTTYTYDSPTNSVMVKQGAQGANPQTRTYQYDLLGRLTSETNPESRAATSYVYDTDAACNFAGLSPTSNGDLISKTDANGNKTCYSYDKLHRVTDIGVLKSGACYPPVKRFRYDSSGSSTTVLPAPTGYVANNIAKRMVEAWTGDCVWPTPSSGVDSATDEWFSYDKRGEMTDLWESTAHIVGYYHGTTGYAANGALTSVGGVPGYTNLTYGLDGEGRLSTAQQGTVKIVCDATCSSSSTTYDVASMPKIVSIGGTTDNDSYTYDPNTERMSNYAFTVGATPKTQSGALRWNADGTLQNLTITDGFNSGGAQNCNYLYDELGRVGTPHGSSAYSVDCGAALQQTFSYDQYANLTQSGTFSWIPGYDATTNHALGVTYDNNGNMTNDTFHNYAWYVDDKLGSTDSTTCTIFGSTNGTCILYDAFGRVVERGINGVYTGVMYTPVGKTAIMNINLTTGATTTASAYFPLPGGATYYQTGTANGSGYFWHKDWLGSVRLASSLGSRAYFFDRAFAPFGQTYDNFGNTANLNFTGNTQDAFTGLFDTPNRELSSAQGRWISPDPAGLGAVDPSNPQTWNRYAYVGNNPNLFIDPQGLRRYPCSNPGGEGCGTDPGSVGESGFVGGCTQDNLDSNCLSNLVLVSGGAADPCKICFSTNTSTTNGAAVYLHPSSAGNGDWFGCGSTPGSGNVFCVYLYTAAINALAANNSVSNMIDTLPCLFCHSHSFRSSLTPQQIEQFALAHGWSHDYSDVFHKNWWNGGIQLRTSDPTCSVHITIDVNASTAAGRSIGDWHVDQYNPWSGPIGLMGHIEEVATGGPIVEGSMSSGLGCLQRTNF